MSNQKLKFDSDSDDPIDLYLIKGVPLFLTT